MARFELERKAIGLLSRCEEMRNKLDGAAHPPTYRKLVDNAEMRLGQSIAQLQREQLNVEMMTRRIDTQSNYVDCLENAINRDISLVRPMPETLCRQNYHQEVEAAVNKQVNIDLYASYVYLSMSFYFDRDDVALPNIAKFFKKKSDEEREHATELMGVQKLRGGRLVLQDIQKPEKTEWESALKAFEAALALERANNESLVSLRNVAGNHNDAHLTGLIEGKYLDEQVRSINEFARYVTTLRRVGPGVGELIFDKEFKD